jgi:hypothetical protein
MASGEDIRKIYTAMKSICNEASQMLAEIAGELARHKFKRQNAAIIWGTSAAVENPGKWLPYFQQRIFVPQDSAKASRKIGAQILFDEPEGRIDLVFPIVLCGILEWATEHKPVGSDNFYNLCLRVKNPGEVECDPPFYKARFPSSWDCSEATGYFLPLVALEDREKLVSLVVRPCLQLFDGNRDAARSAVDGAALTPQQFISDYSSP